MVDRVPPALRRESGGAVKRCGFCGRYCAVANGSGPACRLLALALAFLVGCGGEVFTIADAAPAVDVAELDDARAVVAPDAAIALDATAPDADAAPSLDAPACRAIPMFDFYCDAAHAYDCNLAAERCDRSTGGVWCCK